MRIFNCIVLVFLLMALASSAQTDSLVKGTSNGIPDRTDTIRSTQLHPLRLIIPATLITYGVIARQSGALRNLNNNLSDDLWTRHHHSKTPIDNYLQWSPAVALLGLQLAGIKGQDKFADLSIKYGMSFLLNTALTEMIKKSWKEWRPDSSNQYSFPSGHTSNAFMAAELLRLEYRNVSPWYGVAGYAAAAATGFLRMYNNKHWFSDVVAGAGVGILSTDIVWWTYPVLKRWAVGKGKDVSTMIVPYYTPYTGAGLCLAHHF
ncbi:phosphatase PAP2 family protein [Chitinophaga ginsengisoli]|nr:phosphatase PAP2 family protein [Chitinophaga ginsengisoli]